MNRFLEPPKGFWKKADFVRYYNTTYEKLDALLKEHIETLGFDPTARPKRSVFTINEREAILNLLGRH